MAVYAVKWPSESDYTEDYKCVLRAIKALLSGPAVNDIKELLRDNYETIYTACRAVVTAAHLGEGLYVHVKQEFERCVGTLARSLIDEGRQGVQWLVSFNDTCKWFEQQVVSLRLILRRLPRTKH